MVNNELFQFQYFTLKEVFKRCSSDEIRECIDYGFMPSILTLCHHLDNIRSLFGQPILVTSSFRDIKHNHRVGGSASSQHLKGEAIDFQPYTKNGCVLLEQFNRLCECIFNYEDKADFIGQLIIYPHFVHMALRDTDRPRCADFTVHFTDKRYNSFLYELSQSRNYQTI